MYDKAEVKRVLMARDGMDADEADVMIADAQEEINTIVDEGGSLCEAEDVIADYFGLEPDYLMDFLPL